MTAQDVLRQRVPRRDIVRAGGAIAATATLGSGALRPVLVRAADGTPAPQASPETFVPQALTAQEIAILKAATDRIIPPDDLGPSATEAGVFVYIDRTLAGYNASLLPVFQAGLAALDKAAAPSFADASEARQDEILSMAEAGTLPGDPGGFFATLLEFTRQGMFSDPIHGGNIGFRGWDLIGYPGIKLVWTEADQEIDATPKPEHVSVAQFGGTAE